jgi:hypothetical protein
MIVVVMCYLSIHFEVYLHVINIFKTMMRLSDFITKIRNCKTQAEERAETQKEMSAIRESFSVCMRHNKEK